MIRCGPARRVGGGCWLFRSLRYVGRQPQGCVLWLNLFVFPPILPRYMLWSGYDTLLLQQVPAMQSTSGLGRWKMLEAFTEGFASAWEEEAGVLLGDSER